MGDEDKLPGEMTSGKGCDTWEPSSSSSLSRPPFSLAATVLSFLRAECFFIKVILIGAFFGASSCAIAFREGSCTRRSFVTGGTDGFALFNGGPPSSAFLLNLGIRPNLDADWTGAFCGGFGLSTLSSSDSELDSEPDVNEEFESEPEDSDHESLACDSKINY